MFASVAVAAGAAGVGATLFAGGSNTLADEEVPLEFHEVPSEFGAEYPVGSNFSLLKLCASESSRS